MMFIHTEYKPKLHKWQLVDLETISTFALGFLKIHCSYVTVGREFLSRQEYITSCLNHPEK
jgi:hypothetical protein